VQVIAFILSFVALLVWAESARAQSAPKAQSKTFSVSVSFHKGLQRFPALPPLTKAEVRTILKKASTMLQKPGHTSTDDNDVACDVTLTLNGPLRTFTLPGGGVLNIQGVVDEDNIKAVHAVRSPQRADVHIKVVRAIHFCREGFSADASFAGCAFSPPDFRSMIVQHPANHRGPDHLLWAHEFGHLTGLPHRDDGPEPSSLMTSCDIRGQFFKVPDSRVKVNKAECSSLRAGPGVGAPFSESKVKCRCGPGATNCPL